MGSETGNREAGNREIGAKIGPLEDSARQGSGPQIELASDEDWKNRVKAEDAALDPISLLSSCVRPETRIIFSFYLFSTDYQFAFYKS